MDSQLPSDAELAKFINKAEEILMHARKVARLTQERILKALDQPPPEDEAGIPLKDILYVKGLVGRFGRGQLHTLIDAIAR
jgi:hypothetical protein